jgi:hypothetical protein
VVRVELGGGMEEGSRFRQSELVLSTEESPPRRPSVRRPVPPLESLPSSTINEFSMHNIFFFRSISKY